MFGFAQLSYKAGRNMRVLLIFVVGLMAVAAFPERSQRIVGGSVTNINRYPDMAAMLFSRGTTGHRQGCGGTIINNRSILTAAHCTIGHAPARWQARLGSTNANSGGVVIPSSQIINHPQYNARTADNDVSIVRTSRAIGFTNVIRAGRFAGANFHVGDNQVVWVAGWGMTRENGPFSEQLRHVQVWTVNQNVCAQRYSGINRPITANMLCAGWLDVGGRDACQNDSGGPLYHNGVVVGVTSWGRGCAQPRFPGVYARVQRFANWINQNR